MATYAYFMKIDGIDGDAKVKGFEKQIELESFSFPGTSGSGFFVTAGSIRRDTDTSLDLSCDVKKGKATVFLFMACAKGNVLPKAILSCCKSQGDGKLKVYLKIMLDKPVVSSYQANYRRQNEKGSGSVAIDRFTFASANQQFVYYAK